MELGVYGRKAMIKIYGTSRCGYCKEAVNLAKKYKLEYEYKNVSQIEYLEEFVEKFPGAKTVPQIVWYDKVIGTYENFATEIENTIGGYGENVI